MSVLFFLEGGDYLINYKGKYFFILMSKMPEKANSSGFLN